MAWVKLKIFTIWLPYLKESATTPSERVRSANSQSRKEEQGLPWWSPSGKNLLNAGDIDSTPGSGTYHMPGDN